MGALDPSEVRKGLAEDGEFDIEKLLDNMPDEDLLEAWGGGESPTEPDESKMKPLGGSDVGGARESGDDDQSTVRPTAVSPLQNSAKPLTGRGQFDRMNSSESINDGGPGSGSLSSKDKAKYDRRILGMKTSTGTEIKSFSDHAYQRLAQRRISPNRIEWMFAQKPEPDKTHLSRDVYKDNGAGIVVDRDTGIVVTIMWTGKK
jgi:hypothetical protein